MNPDSQSKWLYRLRKNAGKRLFFHFPITSIGTVIVLGGMQALLSQAW